MIDFIDKKYGRVVIYEPSDIEGVADYPSGDIDEIEQWYFEIADGYLADHASVVGFRDTKKGRVKVVKNRYRPLEDYETEMFILNYKIKTDVKRLTKECTICYCKDVEVDLEDGIIRCQSSKCGARYCLNDREKENIRIYFKIGFVESRFDILDL